MNPSIGAGAKRLHGIMLKQAVLVAVSTLMLILLICSFRNPLFAGNDYSSSKEVHRSLREVPSVIKDYALRQEDVSDEIYQLEVEVRKGWDCEPQLENEDLSTHQFPTSTEHPHSVVAMVSCTPVHYRCAINPTNFGRIVFGVLSSSRERRDAIRSTWAKGTMPSASAFFVVAGPWENYEEEYNTHHDIIWVDQEDLYSSPTPGGLTMKTNTFLLVAYNQIMKYTQNTEYFIKADDDSYFDTDRLYAAIQQAGQNGPVDFGGNCYSKVKPFRNHAYRGWQSYEDYPFNYFPPLCWGGIGYVMSPKFMQCAVGEGHIERLHYLSIEDGSTGLLAERCGMSPKSFYGNYRFQVYKSHWKDHDKKELMKDLIVQHNLKTKEEIHSMHDSMQYLAQGGT